MQAFSALCTGAAAGAVGTYHMYHAVWKSRDHVAESSSMYVQQHDPTGRQVRRRGSACACTRRGLASSRASCNPERAHAPRAPSSARLPCPPRTALSCPRSGCTTRSRKSSPSGGTRLSSACTACSQTCSRARQSEPLAGRSARSISYAVRLHHSSAELRSGCARSSRVMLIIIADCGICVYFYYPHVSCHHCRSTATSLRGCT